MKLIPHIHFEDFERRDFKQIASVSILCDALATTGRREKDDPKFLRLSVVRQASSGDLMSPDKVRELVEALEGAIVDRADVVSDMQTAGHPELARAAEAWFEPLRRCLEHAEQAQEWVGVPELLDVE
jgi:hypothetical protein